MLTILLLALIAGVGLCHLVVDGSIFAKWRGELITKYRESRPWVVELISCYQCAGFWSGVVMGLILQPVEWNLFAYMWWWLALVLSLPLYLLVTPIIIGCATSYLSMGGAALLNWLDAPAMAIANKKKEDNHA